MVRASNVVALRAIAHLRKARAAIHKAIVKDIDALDNPAYDHALQALKVLQGGQE